MKVVKQFWVYYLIENESLSENKGLHFYWIDITSKPNSCGIGEEYVCILWNLIFNLDNQYVDGIIMEISFTINTKNLQLKGNTILLDMIHLTVV